MKINKKIKGFTIAEMLVVLVISAIVISLALLVLGLVQRQVYSIQKNINRTNEVVLLERLLWQDFNKNNLFYNNEKELLLAYNSKDTIQYEFTNTFIIRNKDTLKVGVLSLERYLEGAKTTSNNLDAVELVLTNEFQSKNLFIFTKKDATYFMESNKQKQ